MENLLTEFYNHKDFFYLILFCAILGIETISHISIVLLPPMNSALNSIHGLIVIGGIIIVGEAKEEEVTVLILGFIAIIMGVMNLVGCSLFTDRMLRFFKRPSEEE